MPLRGEFTPPGDKSISHRLILMSLLAEGEMTALGLGDGDDIKTSLNIFKTLGGEAGLSGNRLAIKGLGGRLRAGEEKPAELDCGNSGTTARLLAGIVLGRPGTYIFDGDAQLRRRPMERLAQPLRRMGGRVETSSGHLPLTVRGGAPLHGIEFINHEGSAQLKGAVILAALQAEGPSRIIEPAATREHTEKLAAAFGARVALNGQALEIQPGRLTLPPEIAVPADPSSAAFFLVGAALIPGSLVTARNVLLSPRRTGFLRVLDRMGAAVSIRLEQDKPEPSGRVSVEYNGPLKAVETEAGETPSLVDEVPILALAAACAEGSSVFRNMRELRLKETDRLTAIRHQLGALGVRVRTEGDDLFVNGPARMTPPETLDSGGDHRLAMTLLLARHMLGARTPVLGEDSISISYPSFKDDLARLTA